MIGCKYEGGNGLLKNMIIVGNSNGVIDRIGTEIADLDEKCKENFMIL